MSVGAQPLQDHANLDPDAALRAESNRADWFLFLQMNQRDQHALDMKLEVLIEVVLLAGKGPHSPDAWSQRPVQLINLVVADLGRRVPRVKLDLNRAHYGVPHPQNCLC